MATPPPPGSTATPRPDDDCLELMGEAYRAGFADGYEYMLKLCRRYHRIWFKKGGKPPRPPRRGGGRKR